MLTTVLEDGTQRVTRRALRPGERRHNNHFIAPPDAQYAGKDTPDDPEAGRETEVDVHLHQSAPQMHSAPQSQNNRSQRSA